MNELSVEIKNTFTNLVKIYSETSSLLLDADSYLEKNGFICPHGNKLGTEQSKNMTLPSRWITYYASRFYISDSYDNIVLALSVFFLDAKHKPIEPIMVFGVLNIKLDEDVGADYFFIREAWFNFKDEFELDKKYKIDEVEEKWKFESATLMAIKLTDIKGQNGLENKVINPLLEFIKER